MYLVNVMHALVLFDLVATRSFVSFNMIKKFYVILRELDFPLEVEINDDCIVSASGFHHD